MIAAHSAADGLQESTCSFAGREPHLRKLVGPVRRRWRTGVRNACQDLLDGAVRWSASANLVQEASVHDLPDERKRVADGLADRDRGPQHHQPFLHVVLDACRNSRGEATPSPELRDQSLTQLLPEVDGARLVAAVTVSFLFHVRKGNDASETQEAPSPITALKPRRSCRSTSCASCPNHTGTARSAPPSSRGA